MRAAAVPWTQPCQAREVTVLDASRPAVPRSRRSNATASSNKPEATTTVTSSNRKMFPDHYNDYRARQYRADVGRFVQRDPMGMRESANLHSYALNDPVDRYDPLGGTSVGVGAGRLGFSVPPCLWGPPSPSQQACLDSCMDFSTLPANESHATCVTSADMAYEKCIHAPVLLPSGSIADCFQRAFVFVLTACCNNACRCEVDSDA
ncbi:MAG: hypothetical protein DRQ55_15990 [Planctomycetota bacterium]|nr:MAG: hypothetical protein DRQ55_15990 [Planctomycetota bacterium]